MKKGDALEKLRSRKKKKKFEDRNIFKSFSKNHEIKNTIRTIEKFSLNINDGVLEFSIIGTGFMYNMVRIIAGTLIQVGKGKFNPEYVKEMLDAKDRTQAGQTAPPQGLTLMKIEYL